MSSTLTVKGQATIPAAVREHLGVGRGSMVDFLIHDDGSVSLRPATRDVASLKGMLPRPKNAATVEDMDRAVRHRAKRRHGGTR